MRTYRLLVVWAGTALFALALVFSGCGGSSESPAIPEAATNRPTVTPTVTAMSGNTIMATGGGGSNAARGGTGGRIEIRTYSPKGISIRASGIAPTGFTVPAYNPAPDFGPNKAIVDYDTAVKLLGSGAADPGNGVLYMTAGNENLYKGNGNGTVPDDAEVVTGLQVKPGITLTLQLNRDMSGSDGDGNQATGQDMTGLDFLNDIEVLGTIKVKDLATVSGTPDSRHSAPATIRDIGDLTLTVRQMFVRPSGVITTAGLPAVATSANRGGDGGSIQILADNFFINEGLLDASGGKGDGAGIGGDSRGIRISVAQGTGSGSGGGVVVNKGKIFVNGGDGSTGGRAGSTEVYANSHIFNTGPISSAGGKGIVASGENGAWVQISSCYGGVFNSAAISATGGTGNTGGGNGGIISFVTGAFSNFEGNISNAGVLNVSGGSATGNTGNGGGGGRILIGVYFDHPSGFGMVSNSGSLIANGGDSQGAGNGGNAGQINIWNAPGREYWSNNPTPVQPIQISGNIGLRGGTSYAAGNGGAGGLLSILQNLSIEGVPSQGGVVLLGYAKADLSGGSGTGVGGAAYGGDALLLMTMVDYGDLSAGPEYVPPGPIYNEIAIIAKGGNGTGTASAGGHAGQINWQTVGWVWDNTSFITNRGTIDVAGGSGGTGGTGGNSGGLYWYGHDGVTNSGPIFATGGASVGGTGGGGSYHGIVMQSSLDITNAGAITTMGGAGMNGGNGANGWGNAVKLYAGGQVKNSSNIVSNGGAGTSGTSGSGGYIDIMSESKPTSNTALLMSVAPGAVTTGLKGVNGEIWIDWVNVTPLDGTRP